MIAILQYWVNKKILKCFLFCLVSWYQPILASLHLCIPASVIHLSLIILFGLNTILKSFLFRWLTVKIPLNQSFLLSGSMVILF